MNVSEVFARVGGILRRRQEERTLGYQGAVQAVADGREIDHNDLADVLESAGRTAEQFENDVKLVLERRTWKATLAKKPAVQAELDQLNAADAEERERHKRAFDEEERRFSAEIRRMNAERLALTERLAECERARQSLERTSGMQQKIADLGAGIYPFAHEAQFGETGRHLRQAEGRLQVARARLRSARQVEAADPLGAQMHGKSIDACEREVAEAEANFKRWQAEVEKLNAQADARRAAVEKATAEALEV